MVPGERKKEELSVLLIYLSVLVRINNKQTHVHAVLISSSVVGNLGGNPQSISVWEPSKTHTAA